MRLWAARRVTQPRDVGRSCLRSLITHEPAHQWFHALVGNDQARDPWIDEAFATYAQAVVAD